MSKSLVEGMVGLLNDFSSKEGVSQTMNPAMIVTGAQMPDHNMKRIVFGSYAQVHMGTTNTMKHGSMSGIVLSNEEGGTYFMSLLSGRQIHSHNWTETLINDEVIAKVEELACFKGQPGLPEDIPVFEQAPGIEVETCEEDDESVPELQPQEDLNIDLEAQDEYELDNNVVTDRSDSKSEEKMRNMLVMKTFQEMKKTRN